MKFQKLCIHNIASIEDAIIDFEKSPLADSDVFLITGKTGAGKSTILDAICLALFATTPRMKNTNMQGDISDGKNMTIKDPRQLMRRNTGEAFVSLSFTGNNGVHYEATWSVARARKKINGSIQSKSWQLKNLDTNHILTKDNDVKAEIMAAIGLDFSQFCRTTMLAQGEFTRFLNSKDDEKSEILEKITGVDVYTKIGAKVYAITAGKEQAWREAEKLVDGVKVFSDEEIDGRRKELADLDAQLIEQKAVSDKFFAKREWLKTDAMLLKSMEEAASAFAKAQEAAESEDFIQKELTVKEWNATIDVRSWMTEVRNAEKNKKNQETALNNLSQDFSILLGGKNYLEINARKTKEQIEKIDDFIDKESSKAEVYDNAQVIKSLLNTISERRNAIKKCRADISKEKKEFVDVLMPAYEKIKQETETAKAVLVKEEDNVKSQEEAINALNPADLRLKKDNAKDILGKIEIAKDRIKSLAATEAKHEEKRKILEQRKIEINNKQKKLSHLEAPFKEAEIRKNIRKEDLDKQSDTVDKFAQKLRHKLKIGDICPVCLQEIESELPEESILAAVVEELQKAYEEAEKVYTNLQESKMKLSAEITAEKATYDMELKSFEEDRSVAEAKEMALKACNSCGIKNFDESTISALQTLETSTIDSYRKFEISLKDIEKKESDLKNCRKKVEADRKKFESLSDKLAETEKAINKCKANISANEAIELSKQKELESDEKKADKLIAGNEWRLDYKTNPTEFATSLLSASQTYNNSLKKKQTLTTELDSLQIIIKNISNIVSSIVSAVPAWKDVTPTSAAKIEDIISEANRLNADVVTALKVITLAVESIDTNKYKIDSFLLQHEEITENRIEVLNSLTADDIDKTNEVLDSIRKGVVEKETLLNNAKSLLKNHREKQPEFSEEDTIESLTAKIVSCDDTIKFIGERKGAVCQELKTDEENKMHLATLIKECEKKKSDYSKWWRLKELIGDSTGAKFRKIAQSYVLASLIHSANSYMKTLTDRYTLKITPGTFVISVEDAYQGYATRAASTISGGESFLVSLSLALALSDIGQTLSVDTLFIDEGFGTLSGEPLNNAINTLRTLHTKAGRHVGIISHVEELQERIPVQIQVNQEGNQSSSKVIVIQN